MKRWQIVYGLPLEVWMDIFCFPWISRREFGRLVHQIGNSKFAEHAQFYLHEWGKRQLTGVYFDKDDLRKYGGDKCHLEVPQTPLPPNIKSFDYIQINHFDEQTIDFLAQIRPLLTGVEIVKCDYPPDCLRTILTTLAPMLDGIQSLDCKDEYEFTMLKEHFFCDNEKLAQLKWFQISIHETVSETEQQEYVTFIMNWLTQPDTNGPRLLDFCGDVFMQIYKAIREQFLAATTPRTFAVNLKPYSDEDTKAAEFHLGNSIGELLHGEWIEDEEEEDVFQITRHYADYNTDQEREWIEQMTKGKVYPCIWIEKPTLGAIDAVAQVVVPPMDEEKQVEKQPSASKDA